MQLVWHNLIYSFNTPLLLKMRYVGKIYAQNPIIVHAYLQQLVCMRIYLKLGVFILLVASILAQPNYQERVIYYSETDNVCRAGQHSDNIHLIINIDDTQTIKRDIDGFTLCDQWTLRYANAISPMKLMDLVELDQNNQRSLYIYFDQEATRKYTFGVLSQLIQKATIKNPTILFGKPHTCTIMGDGKLQHFGTWFSTDPAEIYLRCLKNKEELTKPNLITLQK